MATSTPCGLPIVPQLMVGGFVLAVGLVIILVWR